MELVALSQIWEKMLEDAAFRGNVVIVLRSTDTVVVQIRCQKSARALGHRQI